MEKPYWTSKSVPKKNSCWKFKPNYKTIDPKKLDENSLKKDNGKQRPLGIPCILDRIIQQCFKQVLEPIAEARFYKHSYGFRPLCSTHHAMARAQYLINRVKLHVVVDIDIHGFFDNVNHTLLMKQLGNMGIQDKKVLACIMKMLKAETDGEGIPTKGTPQGRLLSPLLSNVVLHDWDEWVAGQWECFPLHRSYKNRSGELRGLKRTRLKEAYIVRYADDFKIFCRDWKAAQRGYHAVRLYLKSRLKLDISSEKSRIVNLRKRESELLGFTIRQIKRGRRELLIQGLERIKSKKLRLKLKNVYKY